MLEVCMLVTAKGSGKVKFSICVAVDEVLILVVEGCDTVTVVPVGYCIAVVLCAASDNDLVLRPSPMLQATEAMRIPTRTAMHVYNTIPAPNGSLVCFLFFAMCCSAFDR